jgi:hypothetical protein
LKKMERAYDNMPPSKRPVKDVYVEEDHSSAKLVVEHFDQIKYSALLREDEEHIDLGTNLVHTINGMLSRWGERRNRIAERYIRDKKNDYAFLYDSVALARHVSLLASETENLLDIGDNTTLMHNRVIAQLMQEYSDLGCNVNSKPPNFPGKMKHDFNIENIRCEVKTIQTFGNLERFVAGGHRLTDSCYASLVLSLRRDLEKAKEQLGKNGMIILSFWSYKLNGLLNAFFNQHNGQTLLPAPTFNSTILTLPTREAFRDRYITLKTDHVVAELERVFSHIQSIGIDKIPFYFHREGLTIELTIPPGSSVIQTYPID